MRKRSPSLETDGGHGRVAKEEGHETSKNASTNVIDGNNVMNTQPLEASLLLREGNGAPSRKGCGVNGQRTKASATAWVPSTPPAGTKNQSIFDAAIRVQDSSPHKRFLAITGDRS